MDEIEELRQEDRLWNSLLGDFNCATYDGAIDLDVLRVARIIREKRPIFYTEIAKELEIQDRYVQLIQYLLCGVNLAEYGTSPRGCWLTKQGEQWLENFEPYYQELISPSGK